MTAALAATPPARGRPSKLSPEQVESLRREYFERGNDRTITMATLAGKYGISVRQASRLIHAGAGADASFLVRGERSMKAKLTEQAVKDIRRRIAVRNQYRRRYPTYEQLAGEYAVSVQQIINILVRRDWKHVL